MSPSNHINRHQGGSASSAHNSSHRENNYRPNRSSPLNPNSHGRGDPKPESRKGLVQSGGDGSKKLITYGRRDRESRPSNSSDPPRRVVSAGSPDAAIPLISFPGQNSPSPSSLSNSTTDSEATSGSSSTNPTLSQQDGATTSTKLPGLSSAKKRKPEKGLLSDQSRRIGPKSAHHSQNASFAPRPPPDPLSISGPCIASPATPNQSLVFTSSGSANTAQSASLTPNLLGTQNGPAPSSLVSQTSKPVVESPQDFGSQTPIQVCAPVSQALQVYAEAPLAGPSIPIASGAIGQPRTPRTTFNNPARIQTDGKCYWTPACSYPDEYGQVIHQYVFNDEEVVVMKRYSDLRTQNLPVWHNLIGLYFRLAANAGHPNTVFRGRNRLLDQQWEKDEYGADLLAKDPDLEAHYWQEKTASPLVVENADFMMKKPMHQRMFEKAIGIWAQDFEDDHELVRTLGRAGWTNVPIQNTDPYEKVHKLLQSRESPQRDALISSTKADFPRFWRRCLDEFNIGTRRWIDSHGNKWYQCLKPRTTNFDVAFVTESSTKMEGSFGRPVQVHSVPVEERAIDSSGKRLPWGLEYHDSLPGSQGQRRPPEEKGPFGRSTRRKATSRTRTATPAKKENPAVDAFSKALQFDSERKARSAANTPVSGLLSDTTTSAAAVENHPVQVILFGYSADTQWAALDSYEKISAGMICEDYAREPPFAKRYDAVYRLPGPKRPLTAAEKAMKSKYDGGEHWVKVTLDSKQAAERAVESSPRNIRGHWVYARMYYGSGPERDEAIPIDADEHDSPRPLRRPNFFNSSVQRTPQHHSSDSLQVAMSLDQNGSVSPDTTSTATSATATGVESPQLRQRQTAQNEPPQTPIAQNPKMMRYFPDQPKYNLRPAAEAFAPQVSWTDRQLQYLRDAGLWPQNMFDNGIIKREDGTLDFSNASIYWRFLYFIDSVLRTDLCQIHAMD